MAAAGLRWAVAGVLSAGVVACRDIPGRDVRFEPTPMGAVRVMLELAEVGPGDVVFDLDLPVADSVVDQNDHGR